VTDVVRVSMEIYEKYEDLGKVHTLLEHIRMETTQLCAQLQRPRSNKPSASSWDSTKQDFTNSYKDLLQSYTKAVDTLRQASGPTSTPVETDRSRSHGVGAVMSTRYR